MVLAKQIGPMHAGYHDIDACPTLDTLMDHADDAKAATWLHLAVDKRPEIELYDIAFDPGCLRNLADDPQMADTTKRLADRLDRYLKQTGDPRVVAADGGDIWETYPRFSQLRWFPEPEWAHQHPEVRLIPTGTSEPIAFMIERAIQMGKNTD